LTRDEALGRLLALGFDEPAADSLFAHFDDAERRGKLGHGHTRIEWLESQSFDPAARPVKLDGGEGLDRWVGRDALGYLVLQAICDDLIAAPPVSARVVVAERCFPTGMLGYWVRQLAERAGLVALLTATSPRRLAHPSGGEPLTSTAPLAIAIPSTEGLPVVADVAMSAVTWGAVIAGAAQADQLVPFGGEQAHKAFALAVGLQLVVDALAGPEYGAVLVTARPEHDPVPELRRRAGGLRLPGDA
jgi:LDH2 family malate/lactate/ureidoglycolate dehydrogenase